ncbi:MAG: cyclic nucleotide-binding domain-containing protein [Chloroflexi bacterium]|nr:cyclic nucleotide-binding domain-containing protein [Chloroflexota bacterium]
MPDAFSLLRRIHLFTGLKDDQLKEAARAFVYEEREPNVAIFHQGDAGDTFYIIQSGTVAVVREKGTQEQTLGKLSDGDYFGEIALIYGRKRNATVQTITKVGLWRLDAEPFFALLRQFPQIKENLAIVADTRKDAARRNFKWLQQDEFIYLIAAKKLSLFFLTDLLPALGAFLLSLIMAGVAWYFLRTPFVFYLFGPVALIAAGWIAWAYVDWANDLYIVTNKRVVDYEKVVLIYESRNEAPLSTVRNVTLTTTQGGRILGYGNVVVSTLSGPITFKEVPNPQAMADLIQEQLNRTRVRAAQQDRESLKRSLRQSLGLEKPKEDKTGPVQAAKKGGPPMANPLKQLGGHFTFRVRAEADGVVTYRKHPYVLLQNIWAPSSLFILLAALLGLRIGGVLSNLPGLAFFIAWLIPVTAVVGWWLYQYEDWRNDIYQITPEQVVDIERTPFGQETRKTATIDNIMSVKTERPGFLAWVLNFGTVVIQTGPGGEMKFFDVFNPLDVQQDIFRRKEAKQAKAAQAQVDAEKDRLAKVLGAYYEVTVDDRRRRLQDRQRRLSDELSQVNVEIGNLVMRLEELRVILADASTFEPLTVAQHRGDQSDARQALDAATARKAALENELKFVEHEIRLMDESKAA